MYEKVPTSLNFAEREEKVISLWRDSDIFQKSINKGENAPIFTFYDGPPTANGVPHIGHVLTRAIKDLIPRYKTMKGYSVLRKAGWDTHGLPVELEVEKLLNISGKPEIEKYGIEPFIQKCKESVWKYEGLWREMSERVGFWVDMDNPYVTYHNNYIESVWWALSEIHKQGLIYKSYRVVPYCPRCGTPLSSHEVAQGYKDIKEDSAYVCFKVKGNENEYILAWTTTPWTLPSNVGLCVNPKEEYAKVSVSVSVNSVSSVNNEERIYIMAKALVEKVIGEDANIIETVLGKDLEGLKYEPLFELPKSNDMPKSENCYMVVCDSYVTLTDGTGVVHIAPAFGEDDARIAKAYGLPLLQLVDAQGNFTSDVPLWAGIFVKTADPLIIKELKITGKLFKKLAYEHSYPFCWRCDTPLLYYARDAWFIRVTEVRDKLLNSNDEVNWLPDHMKKGRFGDFLENVIDWSISRERYWGTPLPIWLCTNTSCDHIHCIGSIAELKQMGQNVPDDIELHKPFIDSIKLTCPKCAGLMERTPEVIDCWFDSGCMPFAQWHFPFENKELFEQQFPANFISEGVDQTRGWFYSLLSISTMLFGKSPYENVIVLGLVLDSEGKKMSKSRGNVVSIGDSVLKHGADAVRWYFYSNSAPWFNSRYSDEIVSEYARRFMGTLWNTYAFYVLYAEIDQFNPFEHEISKPSVMDNWLLTRLDTLIHKVDTSLERYEITEAARALDKFVDDLSNWYLRRSRERYWVSGMPQDKINAYGVLHKVLVTVAKLSAPFIPFMTEQIYQNLVVGLDSTAPESIHLTDYPSVPWQPSKTFSELSRGLFSDEEMRSLGIGNVLETQMKIVIDIVIQGRAARNAGNMKTRQPLAEMFIKLSNPVPFRMRELDEIILDELNIKKLTFIDDASEYSSYKLKPQLRTLGKRYGKILPKISEVLNNNPDEIMETVKSSGTWKTTIEDVAVELTIDDLLVETTQKEGFAIASDKYVTVVLDTRLTPELIQEGNMRELISKLQTMRREAGFEVTDRINVGFKTDTSLLVLAKQNNIAEDLLADSITVGVAPEGAYIKEWNINGENVELWVKQV